MAHVDASAPAVAQRSFGGRKPLDQHRVLSEAIVFIDDHGLQQLTMRRLGAHLGVEAMALYRYVPGREQLLDGVVDMLMDELYADTMEAAHPATWQHFLQTMAQGVRRLATTHPKIFPLVATRPPAAPWLRPPLRSLRWVDAFLERLQEYGFDAESTVTVYRSFATYLLGALLLEVADATEEPVLLPGERVGGESLEDADLSDFPAVSGLAELLKQDRFAEEFEDSLEDLINRMALLRR